MQTESNRIEILFKRYLDHSISREEYNEFWGLLGKEDINSLAPQLQTLWLQTEGIAPVYTDEEWNRKLKELIQKAEEEHAGIRNKELGIREKRKAARIIPLTKRKTFRWIAAAAVIIAIATTYTVISKRSEKSPATEVAKTNDVEAPKDTRAVITLADGSKVYLDSVNNGTIAQQNNVAVVKNEKGEIEYRGQKSDVGSTIAFNTLFNPRGSKVISLTLSDGTKVWLNSESSLKYPIAFNSNSREVEITGEAYFEVKHNAKQPFKVHLPNGSIVEDLGTAFNINSYSDETDIRTTLVEGSLRVFASPASSAVKIKPGEQAILNRVNPSITRIEVQTVDVEETVAWKNNLFHFESADLKTILKEFARWYDIEVIYEGTISNEKYFTIIRRTTSLNEVLKSLQANNIQFRIEGKKLFVTSG